MKLFSVQFEQLIQRYPKDLADRPCTLARASYRTKHVFFFSFLPVVTVPDNPHMFCLFYSQLYIGNRSHNALPLCIGSVDYIRETKSHNN